MRSRIRFTIKITFSFSISFFLIYKFISYTNNAKNNEYKNILKKDSNNSNNETIIRADKLFVNDNLNRVYQHFKNNTIIVHQSNNVLHIKNASNLRETSINKKYYLILEYTRFFGQTKYCQKKLNYEKYKGYLEDDLFESLNILADRKMLNENDRFALLDECSFKNCFFTCDKKYSNNADALLYHLGGILSEMEVLKKANPQIGNTEIVQKLSPVNTRKQEQIWLLWHDEPFQIIDIINEFKFNWTISFKHESEVSFGAYGAFIPTNSNKHLNEDKLREEFKKRKDNAVWFSSNRKSTYRNRVADQIANYFPVYVYGPCADEVKNRKNKDDIQCPRNSDCEKNLLSESKFYLAFESQNCSDYITEKLWRSLARGIIPVVIQPSKYYYERVAPPNSFIHAQDFNFDFKKLADYMHKVAVNFDLYKKHFEWMNQVDDISKSIRSDMSLENLRMCELCMKLNTERSEIYYESLSKMFNKNCISN